MLALIEATCISRLRILSKPASPIAVESLAGFSKVQGILAVLQRTQGGSSGFWQRIFCFLHWSQAPDNSISWR